MEFLRDVSANVVDDIEGAATTAQQAGAALSAVSGDDQADINLLNRARDSIGAVETGWVQRVRNAGVSCG